MIAPSRRLIASCLLLMAASLLISLLGLAQGPVPLTIDQVFSALFGDAPRNVAMVVNEWRLPPARIRHGSPGKSSCSGSSGLRGPTARR